jgi:hypothetical protein
MQNFPSIELFNDACRNGNLVKVTEFLETYQECLEKGLELGCESGHESVFQFLTTHGAKDFERALKAACRGGNVHLIETILEQHPTDVFVFLCMALNETTDGAVNHALNRIAKVCNFPTREATLYHMFLNACELGETETALKLVKRGAFDWNMWNMALQAGCRLARMNTVQLAINHSAYDWDWGLFYAARALVPDQLTTYLEIMDLMVTKGATNMDLALENACLGGHPEIVKFLLDKGAKNLTTGREIAVKNGHESLVVLFDQLATVTPSV